MVLLPRWARIREFRHAAIRPVSRTLEKRDLRSATGQFTTRKTWRTGAGIDCDQSARRHADGRFPASMKMGNTNSTREIYAVGSGWSPERTASPFTPPLYPRMHLIPNGKSFFIRARRPATLF